ncbi:Fc.00g012890.m01.CDS01 [Cosmosporella sp. VM-42]
MATKSGAEDDPAPGDTAHGGFERQLPDNCVEYILFVLDPSLDSRKQLSQIETIRKSALRLSSSIAKGYIWQKDEFNLELRNEQGLVYLHGITDYGDAVEDEWLIVYLLRELTRSHPNLWARVFDTDGEFLLVEAANVLPKWLSPEIDHNRVWIHQGKLLIIPLKEEAGLKFRTLMLPDAVETLKTKPDILIHSTFIEAEAFYRLEKYPGQISDSIHHSLVTIPRKLVYIIHSAPKSVAPAVEVFYLRDPINLKRVISPTEALTFPPEDLITVSVRFSKVLYAQLRSQRFDAPPPWQAVTQKAQKGAISSDTEQAKARLDIGMKLACGFEMLAANAENSKSRVVRELAIVLEDLQEDGEEALPSDDEIKTWKDATRDDSEAWLDINYEDFERELDGKRSNAPKGADSGFGDVNTQSDLRKIVSRFEAFLNDDDAGAEGAELDDMDFDDDDDDSEDDSEAEDKDVSFDEDEFARMMREMMGIPSTAERPKTEAKGKAVARTDDRNSDAHEEEDEEDEEIKKLTSEMEAELNKHGALKLDPATEKPGKLKAKEAEAETTRLEDIEEDIEEDSEEEVDIDFNLAKNLLESFKSQGGMAGPTGNLLGMMGFQLPRDEDDGEEEENVHGGPSRRK